MVAYVYQLSIYNKQMIGGIGLSVTETTFDSLSVISWPSALLVEETGVHRGGGTLFHHNSKTNVIK